MAMTIQQVEGLETALLKLKRKNKIPQGCILLLSHSKTGRLLKKTDFLTLDNNISVYECCFCGKSNMLVALKNRIYTILKAWMYKLNGNEKIVYVASTVIDYKLLHIIESRVPDSKVIFVLLEDGAGAYINKIKNYIADSPIDGCYGYVRFVKGLCNIAYDELLKKILYFRGRIIDNRLFLKEKKRFIRNQEIAPYYDELYRRKGLALNEDVINEFTDAVIINTQCLKENGITDGEIDFSLYKRLITELKNIGVKVVIKTHPRELNPEKYEQFGCPVFSERRYSQELIIAATKIKPRCIVSIYSSTLLNAKGIFGIPVISLANVFMQEYTVSRGLKKVLLDYVDDYRNIIDFPSNMDDAIEWICSKKNN